MIVRKFSEAKAYEAPNHRDYKSFRLFGAEMGGSQSLIFGISHFLPGGGAGPDASPPEKIYFILDGELTVIVDGRETVAKRGDSVYIGPNESREIVNRSNEVCTIAVAVAPVKYRHRCVGRFRRAGLEGAGGFWRERRAFGGQCR